MKVNANERTDDPDSRQLTDRLRWASRVARFGFYDLNLATGDFFWSRELKALVGLAPDAVVEVGEGQIPTVVHPEDRDRVHRRVLASLVPGGNGQLESEFRITLPSGETRWMLVRGLTVFHEGRAMRATGLVADINERRMAEEALRENEARYRAVLENSLDAAYRRDLLLNRYDYISPVIETITGYTPEEMSSMSTEDVLALMHPDQRAAVVREMEQALVAGRGTVEYQFRTRWGGYRWLADSFTVLHNEGGQPIYRGGIVRDITGRKRAEDALRHLNETLEEKVAARTRQVRELAARLSQVEQQERHHLSQILHDELQQRLYASRVLLSLLKDTLQQGEIEAALSRLEQVDEVLGSSIEVSRRLSVDLSPPILQHEGLVEALDWLASQMAERYGLQLQVLAASGLPRLEEGLRILLLQMVRELLLNVVRHAGIFEATLHLAEDNGHLIIQVADHGEGFEARSMGAGTLSAGQGLQIIRQRLELVGGRLHVESTPGSGTVITVDVPVE